MAEEEVIPLTLKDDFYRDHFKMVVLLIISLLLAFALLILLSAYLYLEKPRPTTFQVGDEWRVRAEVPLDQPYLSQPELLQWANDAVLKSFSYDFLDYDAELKAAEPYFTPNGWKVFMSLLNTYAAYNTVEDNKLYVTVKPTGAPIVTRPGILPDTNQFGWWLSMPISIQYTGVNPLPNRTVNLQVLVVRVSTLNNLMGIAIENMLADVNGETKPT